MGPDDRALKEAHFLKDYTARVVMLFKGPQDVSDATRRNASAAGIEIWDAVDEVMAEQSGIKVVMAPGLPSRELDVFYPAMGCHVRSELATNLGADCDEEGYVLVGPHLETSVPGLYAIGDVARALNQIAVGFGHAALAASHIHNALRDRDTRERARASA
jgi:thioredoxin reductase (NADPH)